MDVTHPKLIDDEGTGSIFPPKCLYLLATTAYHPTRLESSSKLPSEPENSNFP
jgi:hypothetical protein